MATMFDVYPLAPVTITRAQGSYVWDDSDQRYLDMYGGHAVICIGHTHSHWVARIQDQLQQIAFYSNSIRIPIQQEVASLLGKLSGHPNYQLFMCNSGAEANENALKLASFHTNRKLIVSFTKAFHGRTSLAVAATDQPAYVAPVNETSYVHFLPFNDVAAIEDFFAQHGEEVAAVIIEGIQGVGGIHEASDIFLQSIRRLCDEYGAVYIADSVQCGYGRTGQFFAHDHAGVSADIYTMAKGMGNGFPVAGIFIAPHIQPRYFMLGTTFGGNPLACAAALAVLEVMDRDQLMQHAASMGSYLKEQLKTIPSIKNIRGRGLMIGFDVPTEFTGMKKRLFEQHKIFTGEAKPEVIRLLPALNITKEEIDIFIAAVKADIASFS
ncbi:MAG: aminotransferase class III-fold pyridoxal phosphate-dependent enzyme [Hydrotalea sp.]|nr:aminotransferase class III-fold pyridoxal phosphate-dependent enzyme [Hydrotalea sp.]